MSSFMDREDMFNAEMDVSLKEAKEEAIVNLIKMGSYSYEAIALASMVSVDEVKAIAQKYNLSK